MLPGKVVSGGQTGVDRAALDAALKINIPCGGWCPAGRRAEDGRIPDEYPLRETASNAYEERTRLNVLDSDATLICNTGDLEGGTLLTARLAEQLNKPLHVASLDQYPEDEIDECSRWIISRQVRVLNVAGPRSSKCQEIYQQTLRFMVRLLRKNQESYGG